MATTIRIVPPYFDDPIYKCFKIKLRRTVKKKNKEKTLCVLFMEFQKYFLRGDPYHCHCAKQLDI